eukprot:5964294-Amphidinium_carterae.1
MTGSSTQSGYKCCTRSCHSVGSGPPSPGCDSHNSAGYQAYNHEWPWKLQWSTGTPKLPCGSVGQTSKRGQG